MLCLQEEDLTVYLYKMLSVSPAQEGTNLCMRGSKIKTEVLNAGKRGKYFNI